MSRITHLARPANIMRITFCGQYIDNVPLAPCGEWPTCAACVSGVSDNPRLRRALSLTLPAPAAVQP